MQKINNFLIYSLIIILILFSVTGCSISENEQDKSEEKIKAEIDYLEDCILKIVNKYAKKEYTLEDDTLDWKAIEDDEKSLLDSLDTIVLDLSELNINNEDIINLSDGINNLIILTTEENEIGMISKLKDIYSLIPKYLETVENDENIIDKKKVKYLILVAYSSVVSDNLEQAQNDISELENKYKDMMNNLNYAENNNYNLNNVYVLIEEFKNAIGLKNREIIDLKYINLIEKI